MSKEEVKVLLVDDDEDDYIITRDLLSEVAATKYDIEWVRTYNAGIEAIKYNNYDVCLLDFLLGGRTGLELLQEAIADGCTVPIILLTGKGTREVDMEAMKAGASDYLCKKAITVQLLERSIRYAIERKRSEERILQMAYFDILTNLPNRSLFHDRLKQALAHAERYKVKIALLFLDLDNFKRINDTLEHRAGDLLLQAVAERLSNYVRMADTVARQGVEASTSTIARLGGDEFIVLLKEINSMQNVAKVAQRILSIISKPYRLEGHEVFVTASIGIALYPTDGNDADTLLKNADTAMYHAKEQGKDNFQFYKQSMNASAFERLILESCLRRAMDREEFLLYYQPRMDIRTEKIVGMEALIRWNHPEKGLLHPREFIPLAEETGIILPMGEWVLKTACEQNKIWLGRNPFHTRIVISLNLSGQQLRQDSFIKIVEKVVDDTELDPKYIELEITESVIMKNPEMTITTLYKLKNMGLRLSMDDFGTGYSSFNHLKRFPLDIIKIDRSFIKDITRNSEDMAIVKAIIAMAHTLKLNVIAEGVETEQQLAFLREQGCDEIQGYVLSRPIPAEEIPNFLAKRKDVLI